MTTDTQRQAYRGFFLKNEAGQEFMKFVTEEIETEHRNAEKHPEEARDHTQTAKAYRSVLDHINSLVAEGRPIA